MNSTAAGKDSAGWEEDGSMGSPVQSTPPTADIVPAGFTRDYHLLAEVAANMSSGFLLLNAHERVAYVNPSALRLLRTSSTQMTTGFPASSPVGALGSA